MTKGGLEKNRESGKQDLHDQWRYGGNDLVKCPHEVFLYLGQELAPLDVELHHGVAADPGEAGLGADQGVVEEKQVAQLPNPVS